MTRESLWERGLPAARGAVTIMRTYSVIPYVVLAAAIACSPVAEEELPPFVTELIATLEAEPKANPPASVWRYNYKGDVVFYVPPSCCDVPSALYAADGSVICGPDGGITGKGDGRCPDFFEVRTEEKLIWSDDR